MKFNRRIPWMFLAPQLSLFCVFLVLPIAAIIGLSLFDWNLLGDHHFVGVGNYTEILSDRRFWHALRNTAVLSAVVVPVTTFAGFALAVALNQPLPARNFFRAAIYLPTAISAVASAQVASWIFSEQYGVANALLEVIGLPRVPWLSSPQYALPTVIATTVWLRTGLCMVVYLAALQEVPQNLLDAAALDGAGFFDRLRYVVWPLLKPTTTFLLITNIIYSLHLFDLIYVMTHGGPAFSTAVLVQYLYDSAFREQREGYASAISVILVVILLVLTTFLLINRRESRRKTA